MRLWLDAGLGIVRRDALLFVSYRAQLLTRVFGVAFSLLLFFYVSRLVAGGAFATPRDYFVFVVVGLIIVQVLTTSLAAAPQTIRQELVAGTLERLLVSPFGVVSGVLAVMVFPLLTALATGVVMLALAVALFGFPLAATAPLAIPVAVLGAVAFLPFSLLLAALVVLFKQAAAGAQLIVAGLSIAGGLYFPVTLLPTWIRWVSEVQPFTPAADLLRHLISGAALQDPLLAELARIALFAVVLLPLSLLGLRAAVRTGQRRGTIFEY